MPHIGDNELVFNRQDGKIQSGGFTIDSILLQKGGSPLTTLNSNTELKQNGGGQSVSELFKNLAVPSGLLHFENKQYGGTTHSRTHKNGVISEDIYEKLLKFVEVNVGPGSKSRKTRKPNIVHSINSKGNKKTRKSTFGKSTFEKG